MVYVLGYVFWFLESVLNILLLFVVWFLDVIIGQARAKPALREHWCSLRKYQQTFNEYLFFSQLTGFEMEVMPKT